jgi:hypothetical protein
VSSVSNAPFLVRFSKSTQKPQIFLLVPPDKKKFQPTHARRLSRTAEVEPTGSPGFRRFSDCFRLFQTLSACREMFYSGRALSRRIALSPDLLYLCVAPRHLPSALLPSAIPATSLRRYVATSLRRYVATSLVASRRVPLFPYVLGLTLKH